MDLFRWILVGVGILVLLGLFIYAHWSVSERRRGRKADRKRDTIDQDRFTTCSDDDRSNDTSDTASFIESLYGRSEPSISGNEIDFSADDYPRFHDKNSAKSNEPAKTVEPHIIVMHVVAQEGEYFTGQDILAAMRQHNLRYGKMKIFHRVVEIDGKKESLFGIANMIEPGVFEGSAWDRLKTPGLALFLQIPAPIPGVDAFDEMIDTAMRLQESLNGMLLDDYREPMTTGWIDEIRLRLVSSTA